MINSQNQELKDTIESYKKSSEQQESIQNEAQIKIQELKDDHKQEMNEAISKFKTNENILELNLEKFESQRQELSENLTKLKTKIEENMLKQIDLEKNSHKLSTEE